MAQIKDAEVSNLKKESMTSQKDDSSYLSPFEYRLIVTIQYKNLVLGDPI